MRPDRGKTRVLSQGGKGQGRACLTVSIWSTRSSVVQRGESGESGDGDRPGRAKGRDTIAAVGAAQSVTGFRRRRRQAGGAEGAKLDVGEDHVEDTRAMTLRFRQRYQRPGGKEEDWGLLQ